MREEGIVDRSIRQGLFVRFQTHRHFLVHSTARAFSLCSYVDGVSGTGRVFGNWERVDRGSGKHGDITIPWEEQHL